MAPNSKNRRCNVSIAVSFEEEVEGKTIDRCIVVDVGKTMRETFLRLLPMFGIRQIDSILLTHGHADAILGLDDVRDLQTCSQVTVVDPTDSTKTSIGFKVDSGPLHIYLHQETMDTVKKTFEYLTITPKYLDEANFVLERRVALLDFNVIDPNSTFYCHGLRVRSFPVYHGGEYVSLGFSFGLEGEFVYISDVKIIPDDTLTFLKSIPKIKVLVLDCLSNNGIFSHFGLSEALECADKLNPDVLYLTGMGCGFGLHDEREASIQKLRENTYLAYDSLMLDGFRMR